MTPTPVLVRPDQIARAREIQLFYALGIPGMTLLGSPKPPKPEPEPKPKGALVYRCVCGVPISRNKSACRMCYEIRLMELGEKIESQATLDGMLNDLDPQERAEALARIKPYLKF
jgi:hypothetical protein